MKRENKIKSTVNDLDIYIYYYIMVHATTMCLPHVHPPCVYLKATMLPTCALTSYL